MASHPGRTTEKFSRIGFEAPRQGYHRIDVDASFGIIHAANYFGIGPLPCDPFAVCTYHLPSITLPHGRAVAGKIPAECSSTCRSIREEESVDLIFPAHTC